MALLTPELYVKQAEYALGTDSSNVYDTAIYDLDRYKIDLIIDAFLHQIR